MKNRAASLRTGQVVTGRGTVETVTKSGRYVYVVFAGVAEGHAFRFLNSQLLSVQ